jgi:hypothetical protein
MKLQYVGISKITIQNLYEGKQFEVSAEPFSDPRDINPKDPYLETSDTSDLDDSEES